MLAAKQEDIFPSVSRGTQAQQSALREELSALKLGGLSKRAIAAGVDSDALEMAQNAGDMSAIIELVVVQTISQVCTRALCELRAFAEASSRPPRFSATSIITYCSHKCLVLRPPPNPSGSVQQGLCAVVHSLL